MDARLLRQLLDIGRQMAETRALAPLLRYAVDITLELLDAQYGYIVLVNDDGTLDFRVRRDDDGNVIEEADEQISRTILYRVIDEQLPVRTANAVAEPAFREASSVKKLALRSVLCVPLLTRGRVLGVIYVENRDKASVFNEDDMEVLQYLASHTAVCIQNAIFNAELESLAHERIHELTELVASEDMSQKDVEAVVDQERQRILYNFIRDASHQFRTPLSVINTNTYLLRRKFTEQVPVNYIDNIEMQVDIVSKLVDSLSFLAKLDSTVDDLWDEHNLVLITKDMVEVMRQRAIRKKQQIELVSEIELLPIFAVLDYARQAIGQVIENAIKYTDVGGHIIVTVDDTEAYAVVTIKDNGRGIAEDDIPKLTTRFYRADSAGTTRGLGLGLSITARIMKIHKGRLEVTSTLGMGSTFRLFFPK